MALSLMTMPAAASAQAVDTGNCLPDGAAFISGRLYGALDVPVDWRGAGLLCEGMPRPDDGGVRLRFAQRIVPTSDYLVIIVGIAEVAPDRSVRGNAATVTVIDERGSRFFSNAGEHCWADVTGQQPVTGAPDARAIAGRVYCTAPLAAVNGEGSVSLEELSFRGRVDWPPAGDDAPQ